MMAEKEPDPAPAGPATVETRTTIERYPFRATIRRGRSKPSGQADWPAVHARTDAPPGQESGEEALQNIFEQLGAAPEGGESTAGEGPAPAAPTPEAAPEEALAEGATAEAPAVAESEAPFTLPDIEVPSLAELGKTDAVKAAFTYSGSIKKGGATPSGFGVTRSFSSKLTGITITPKSGTFEVSATFEHPITYQIRSGTGPSGQVDIASATDADITKTNYPTVVSDLTPDMSDLNGRPPRTKFWAEDLTERHELVHADDDNKNGPGAVTTVTTWLNGKTAASKAEVETLLGKLPGRFAAALLAALSTEAGEKHAYGDGAPLYESRAKAVKAKGDKGDYK